ncbi:hypothetical protein DFH09DRAFT_1326665 [Mycena vulgaris]|nr:hypothetical protein DFH09DRAFT_1326665 [Mycena vulgaris]
MTGAPDHTETRAAHLISHLGYISTHLRDTSNIIISYAAAALLAAAARALSLVGHVLVLLYLFITPIAAHSTANTSYPRLSALAAGQASWETIKTLMIVKQRVLYGDLGDD